MFDTRSVCLHSAALRELSWNGIPSEVRPDVWRLLSGYLPANIDRREITLERKRAEYRDFVQQYYTNKGGDTDALTHQIQVRTQQYYSKGICFADHAPAD